jgi:hypothetical protein
MTKLCSHALILLADLLLIRTQEANIGAAKTAAQTDETTRQG